MRPIKTMPVDWDAVRRLERQIAANLEEMKRLTGINYVQRSQPREGMGG